MLLRNALAIIWIAAVVVIVFCSSGVAVEYTVTQITNDSWYHDHPQINDNGTLVWEGWAGGESYVFLYDGTSTIELGEYPDSNVIPQINNGGYVAWVGWSGTGHEVFLYDGTSTTQLSFSGFLINDSVQINNSGQVVWRLVQFSSIVDSEIFLYDGTDTIQLTDNDCEDRDPQINDNGWVVWRGQNLVQYDIFRYEGSNVRVVANGKEDRDPQMNDNGVVVWETQAAVDSELEMLYSTGIYVGFTNNTYNDAHPQINNDGWVVWQGCVGQTSPTDCDSDWEIFLDP
ncbi:MAG: hypothetical protein ACWGQW_06620, partial [bacterium]